MQKKFPLFDQIRTTEPATVASKTHSWVRECTNDVNEAETNFVYQCILCGVMCVDIVTADTECKHVIFSRYCGYCDEPQWLEDLKFHSINSDNTLFCDLREHSREQYKDFLELEEKK